MESTERFRIVLDQIVSHDGPAVGEFGPRMFNLFIRDRHSGATLNAYLVGSSASVQTVVGQVEFLQFARLTNGAEDVFGSLVAKALLERGVQSISPRVSMVKDLRPLKPPKPI